jgi:hypothetical protein
MMAVISNYFKTKHIQQTLAQCGFANTRRNKSEQLFAERGKSEQIYTQSAKQGLVAIYCRCWSAGLWRRVDL